ncbi:Type IV prepilin peptidase TadV/CpaA [Roseibacterium elongatum DSM 19469]|uniref:Type IV prepilin peptidase TadV/CpaA n=1 Tax=Roseicyclus elongatus DSM 19469 TaxID=1294273 RepID=W8RSX6_9RHOB|nr:prepilin peptidase [Roseibacterium elongatum]AHM04243.1 Type IV prepilin peptidase TadV/CpaA [Roseibacterium elongatum DSM 19469]
MSTLALTFEQSLWFLPLALPICIWVALSDLREMRIPNVAVLSLTAVFLGAGLIVLPMDAYLMRLAQLGIVLVAGFIITSLGLAGAGDSKFAAAMAPFIAPGDYLFFLMLFSLVLIGSWVTHRGAGRVPAVRRATADWASWDRGKLFPMGVALAGALVIYLALGLRAGL